MPPPGWQRAEGQTANGVPLRFTCRGDVLYASLLGVQASAGCGADTPINSSNAFAAVFSPPAFANASAMRWAPGRSVNARPSDDRAVREELLQTAVRPCHRLELTGRRPAGGDDPAGAPGRGAVRHGAQLASRIPQRALEVGLAVPFIGVAALTLGRVIL